MSYVPKVYKPQSPTGGGDLLVVDTGGQIQFGPTTSVAKMLGGGTSTVPVASASSGNFLGFWVSGTHTSGDLRGMYMRLYLTGVGGDGEAGRFYTTVSGTAVNSAHGIHSTLSVAAGGAISGMGAGLRATLEAAAETRTLTGALTALQVDSNVGANNTLPARASLIRLAKAGSVDVTTFLDISDDQCLKGSAATGAAADALKVLLPNGDVKYISLIAAS